MVVAVRSYNGGGGGCFAYCFRVRFWVFLGLGFIHLFELGIYVLYCLFGFVGLGCIFIIVSGHFRPIGVWALPIGCSNFWLDFLFPDAPVIEII